MGKMFEVEPMVKIRVLCAKRDLEGVVEGLYEFGAIHVTRSKQFQPGRPLEKMEAVSPMLVKTRALESAFALERLKVKQTPSGHHGSHSHSLGEMQERLAAIAPEKAEELARRKQTLETRLNDALARKKELAPFKSLRLNVNEIQSRTAFLEFALFEIQQDSGKTLAKAREYGSALMLEEERQKLKMLIAMDKRKGEKVRHALAPYAKEVSLPHSASESFAHEYAALEKQISELRLQLSQAESEIRSFVSAHGAGIVSLRKALETEFKKAELPSKFGESELAASAEGWVALNKFHSLENRLKEKLGDRILVEKVQTSEFPPSKLKNPAVLKPFEFMIEFFSLPRYNEIDPTFITALTFPLFFGMILGDIGYGLVLLLLGIAIMRKTTGALKKIGGIMVLSSISTIIFGFIYAEAFGLEKILGFQLHPLLSRVHEEGIEALFALSVLIGFLHVTLGFLLGAWQGVREKHYKHSYAKIAWLAILFGFIAFLANSMQLIFTNYLQFLRVIPSPFDLGLFVAGIAGVVYFEGPVQLMEIPSLFSNVLSYLRIMALGLSGVALASIVASIPLDFASLATLQPGAIISFVLLALLLVVGHAVAIMLGLLEAGIQSLRLHYVEFYSKFYKGGGTQFVPLRED